MKIFPNFTKAIEYVSQRMEYFSHEHRPHRWQSSDVSNRPEALMREVLNTSFSVSLGWNESLDHYRADIEPNLPWADDHFLERVGGEPLNPGVQWARWPWSLSADQFRTEGGKFSHTYMERMWPKGLAHFPPLKGIRYAYGDAQDVVNHLYADPDTRQAYLPIWFPEDTGVVHGERVPCTLGYHFIQRGEHLHCTYYIRSCDFFRHFRDDLYLTVRLQLWVLDQLRKKEIEAGIEHGFWRNVRVGMFTFHCVSIHCFINDWRKLFGDGKAA